MESPLVSICCLSFNHEKYIRQCLDGIVMQQTSFKFEALVHDDASTDKSQQIIIEYAQKFPDIIKPILQKENQFRKGKGILGPFLCPKCTGKYVAFCECDDYWTDPLKLQKQVDFLETHKEYTFCCHRFSIFEQNYNIFRKEYAYNWYKYGEDLVITEELFLKVWVTQMLTTMIRTDIFLKTIQHVCDIYNTSRDVYLFYELIKQGKGISLNQDMGVYRWNDGGIVKGENIIKRDQTEIMIYSKILEHHPNDKLLIPIIRNHYYRLLRYTNASTENKDFLLKGLTYCDSIIQRWKMFCEYYTPSFFYKVTHKLRIKYSRIKCSISKPS